MRFLTLFFVLITCGIKAEDTLVFSKRSDPAKEYRVVLKQFPFKVFPYHQKKFKALILDVKDSLIVFRQLKRFKGAKKLVRDERRKYQKILVSSQRQLDSLTLVIEDAVNKIIYPDQKIMGISSIKKLKHSNGFIPKKVKRMNAIGITGLGLGFVGLALVGLTGSSIPGIAAFGIWIADMTYGFIAQTKRLSLKKTWEIKRVIRT